MLLDSSTPLVDSRVEERLVLWIQNLTLLEDHVCGFKLLFSIYPALRLHQVAYVDSYFLILLTFTNAFIFNSAIPHRVGHPCIIVKEWDRTLASMLC